MPISPRRHREDPNGEIILIYTPPQDIVNPDGSKTQWFFSGERLGVTFVKGEGQTTEKAVAQALSERFKYEVVLPEGMEEWVEAPDPATLVQHAEKFPQPSFRPITTEHQKKLQDKVA